MLDIPARKSKEESQDPIEYYLSDIASNVSRSWGIALPIFFDFSQYAPEERIADGRHPAEYFFDCVRQLKMQGIPVTGPESVRGPGYAYIEAVSRIAHRNLRGAAIRIPSRELINPDTLVATIDDTLSALSLPAPIVDLFLDFEALVRLPLAVQSEAALLAVATESIQAIEGRTFRNIILCGSSIPESVGNQYNWNPCRVPRMELKVWEKLMRRDLRILLKFGDYGVTYAYERDSDKPLRPPSRIRLSTNTEHVLCRAPREKYRQLCSAVANGAYMDSTMQAWGDSRASRLRSWRRWRRQSYRLGRPRHKYARRKYVSRHRSDS